jgi:hypothetical protein
MKEEINICTFLWRVFVCEIPSSKRDPIVSCSYWSYDQNAETLSLRKSQSGLESIFYERYFVCRYRDDVGISPWLSIPCYLAWIMTICLSGRLAMVITCSYFNMLIHFFCWVFMLKKVFVATFKIQFFCCAFSNSGWV